MKKLILIFIILFFVKTSIFAQWYENLPMSSDYILTSSSPINTNKMLRELSIKKVMIYKNAAVGEKKSFLFFTSFINTNGDVEKNIYCIQNIKKDTFFCYNNIFQYNNAGNLEKYIFTDALGQTIQTDTIEYINKYLTKATGLVKANSNALKLDTIKFNKYFNASGQILQTEFYNNAIFFQNSTYHYSSEGLLDSIKYKQVPALNIPNTIIFKRYKDKNRSILEVTENPFIYKWTYNKEGQCSKLEIASREYNFVTKTASPNFVKKTVVNYAYNLDGTLKKVIEKNKDKPTIILFYYYFL